MAIDGSEILYVTGVYDGSLAAVPQQTTTGAIAALGGNISGNISVGNLTVTGDSTLETDLTVEGNLTVDLASTFTGNVGVGNISGTLGVFTTGNITTVNATTVVGTTGNLTTINSTNLNGTTVVGTTGNLTTINSTTVNGTTGVFTTGNITALGVMPTVPVATPAAAGTVQGNATALSLGMNFVSGADGTAGVILPTTATGKVVEVFNTADGVLKVYPGSGGAINAIVQDDPILQGNLTSARFVGATATQWYTDPRVPS